MDDELLFKVKLDQHRSLCLSPLARTTVDEAGATHLGGDRGYFIYEVNDSPLSYGISILAKAASLEAAFRLVDLWRGAAVKGALA